MFHLAPPLSEGSGVRIFTPGFVRSFQLWMCFGLPGRTMKPTTEVATTDWFGSCSQLCVISPAFCTIDTSGSREDAYTSAGNPFTMFSACVVLPPNDISKIGDWPVFDFHSVANVPDDEVILPYASYGLL